jgi:6-pyruvoyltetrahydropterin/6-carboxytetrahydropterin synthase
MKTFQVIKTFGAERGFSCAFRQWKADSDCKYIHGYSVGFRSTLETSKLDHKPMIYHQVY